jgi:HEAT repeat protein
VRRSVRAALAEFNFKRYLAAFEMLDDEVRRSTGMMVRKIDPGAIPGLKEELTVKSRTRRLRGIAVALAMGAVPDLEQALMERLADEDHLVRAEAARALGHCHTTTAVESLQEARADRSLVVREAAEESLERLMHSQTATPSPRAHVVTERGLASETVVSPIPPIPPWPVVPSPEVPR